MATKRRPRDSIALAKLIGDVATRQVVDDLETVDEAGLAAIKGKFQPSMHTKVTPDKKRLRQRPGKRGS